MKLSGKSFVIKGYVYSGSFPVLRTGVLIRNYTYKDKSTITETSSVPLPAYTLTGSGHYESLVYETCHGINYSGLIDVGKNGDYNFYMAPYGPGYYQPPVGELPTMAEQTFGFSKVFKKQIDDLNLPDYLKIFGLRITSPIKNFIPCKNYNLTAFHEGITDCPINSQPAFKYSEIQAELAAGTYLGSVGGNIYNHNPIPSSYDRGVLVATTLYKSANPTGENKTNENQDDCFYVSGQDLRPIPSFSRGASASSYNYVFGKCANLSDIDRQPLAVGAVDGHTNASVGNPADIISDGDVGRDTSNYDQSIYWNFIFKNNHNVLPFGNTHEAAAMTQDDDQFREDHWWEHRECPENIDYLNHAFGNNINACPMNYVDIPYYAAVGKFGYFGTRFQDTWRKITNDFEEGVGWIPVSNIIGSTRAGGLGAKTVSDKRYVKSPEDNTLYRAICSVNGIANLIVAKTQIECTGDGHSWNGNLDQCDYAYPFSFSAQIPEAYFHSGEEPSIEVNYSGKSGFLLLTNKDTFSEFESPTGGIPGSIFEDNPGVRSFLYNFSPSLYGDQDVLSWAISGELFDNLDLTLQVFQKKKYIDYPYEPDGFVTYQVKEDGTYLDGVDRLAEEYTPHSQGIGTSDYDSLIINASVEKKYYDFAFSDRTLFLALNYAESITSSEYTSLKSSVRDFENAYKILCSQAYTTPINKEFKISSINRGPSQTAYDDPVYMFIESYISTGTPPPPPALPSPNLSLFNDLLRKYGYFKCRPGGDIDVAWYDKLTNEKAKRISKNYYSSIANGSPVDMFPNNQIAFSFEKTIDFANSDLIKSGSAKGGMTLPSVKRQYFSAGFSTDFELSGYRDYINFQEDKNTLNDKSLGTASFGYGTSNVGFPKVTSTVINSFLASHHNFYFGYVNPRGCGKDDHQQETNFSLGLINLPTGGIWIDKAPQSDPPPANNNDSPVRNSWPDVGLNKIGKLDSNFSCFSPLFLQQPLSESVQFCQAPKFRVYAVDYHSIPEDKIQENRRGGGSTYPEVAYWLRKIKAINAKGDNLYPLSYQWHRILKIDAQEYITGKSTGLLQTPSGKGTWCCAEDSDGRTPECTVIRPLECIDINGVDITNWSGHSEEYVRRFMGVKDNDTNYFYFCNVSGRFGWRSSEFASVDLNKKVTAQVAVMNMCGGGGSVKLYMAGLIFDFNMENGYLPDPGVYFEQVKDTNWNDRNNCETVRFIGPEGLRGVTRVYTPSTFVDPRGKKIRNDHWKDFGALVSSTVSLDQNNATWLYADRALPYCDRTANTTYAGVPFQLRGFIHRTHFETAALTDNTTFGVRASKLRSIAELYPPRTYTEGNLIPNWDNRNPGHHQFENNMGSIKEYSLNKANNTLARLTLLNGDNTDAVRRDLLMTDFNKAIRLTGSRIITGPECGYQKPSMGRLMHFYVESFATYYLLCETGVKPKKVKNISHISGGLRTGRPGLQYNWLGKPNDSRLKRVSMPGPYAFQWKVERHNRDRYGNGMPLSFWSYHWEERMDNLYDAAAVYGAVKKTKPSYSRLGPGYPSVSGSLWDIRQDAANSMYGNAAQPISLRNASIGPDDGPKLGCGSIRWRASGELGGDKPTSEFVSWMESVANPAGPDPFSVNGCNSVGHADCFYPCISLKYPEGFTPKGGKNLGYRNGNERHYITSSIITGIKNSAIPFVVTLPSSSDGTSKIFRIELSPCSRNRRDVCNYITPTIHVGIDTWPFGRVSSNTLVVNAAMSS